MRRNKFSQPRTAAEMLEATLAILIFAALVVFGMIGLVEMAKPARVPGGFDVRSMEAEIRYRANQ